MGRKRINMVGEVYGRLTVEAYAGTDKSSNSLWMCRCECGNSKLVTRGNLITGRYRSCGCNRKGILDRRSKNLLNKKFGKITVLAQGHARGYRDYWLCQCDCGKKLDLRDDQVKKKHDCGCEKTAKDVQSQTAG